MDATRRGWFSSVIGAAAAVPVLLKSPAMGKTTAPDPITAKPQCGNCAMFDRGVDQKPYSGVKNSDGNELEWGICRNTASTSDGHVWNDGLCTHYRDLAWRGDDKS